MLRFVALAALALREQTSMMEVPVPVDQIAEIIVDLLDEKALGEGRDGMVVQYEGMTAITINSRVRSRGRKRFTLGHELGHVRLHEGNFTCLARDVGAALPASPQEREANAFASELLMPEPEFRRALGLDIPDLETVAELADARRFDVSVTAAALRAVNVTDHQCVLIVSQNGVIQWSSASPEFQVWVPRRGQVPRDSATARACKAGQGSIECDCLDATAWLDDRRIRADTMELEEEAMATGDGWVLTLLSPVEEVDVDGLGRD